MKKIEKLFWAGKLAQVLGDFAASNAIWFYLFELIVWRDNPREEVTLCLETDYGNPHFDLAGFKMGENLFRIPAPLLGTAAMTLFFRTDQVDILFRKRDGGEAVTEATSPLNGLEKVFYLKHAEEARRKISTDLVEDLPEEIKEAFQFKSIRDKEVLPTLDYLIERRRHLIPFGIRLKKGDYTPWGSRLKISYDEGYRKWHKQEYVKPETVKLP